MRNNLSELIEFPRETPENEYKNWVDLQDPFVRAKIARHLAALANNGSGYLIFGFKDDKGNLTLEEENRPASINNYSQDTFTDIVKRYLQPVFQCDVEFVADKNGKKFPVVRVPSHGRVPIIAKADGPQDPKGKPQGILVGKYYIRKPGPESAPINDPREWSDLIRRCTLNDRDSLLRDFANIVHPPEDVTPDTQQRLESWHQKAEERFLDLLSKASSSAWPVPFEDNHYQLSYLISSNGEEIPTQSLRKVLIEVHDEVRDTVRTNWSMFHTLGLPANVLAFLPEEVDGTGESVLEFDLTGDSMLPEFWRVAPDGRASLIRAYVEDRNKGFNDIGQAVNGTWLSPKTIIRKTGEFVTHAMLLAKRFETAIQVSFICSWMGLENREIADFNPSVYWHSGRKAKTDKRVTGKTYTTAELAAKWSTVVSDLACPVLYLFGLNCGQDFVESMKQKFIR